MSALKRLRWAADGLCVLAATATIAMYLSILVHSGGTLWVYAAVCSGWSLVPYIASVATNRVAVRSRIAVTASFCCSLLISAVGLFAITAIHRNTMMLIRDPEAMNCVGPIFEFGAPLVQLALLVPAGLVTAVTAVLRKAG